MKPSILIVLIFTFCNSYSQRIDTVYTSIEDDILGQDAPSGKEVTGFFWGSSFDYAVFEFSNILRTNINDKKEQQRIENNRAQAFAKVGIIKNQYGEYKKYPEKIVDGWHSVIATDNINFCKDVKVLVNNNKIVKFVIDNYLPLNFKAVGEIKNGKNVITLNNFNGEQLNVVEVYFLYDLEEQSIVPPPIKPGYICFWTSEKNYKDIILKIDDRLTEDFSIPYQSRPDCFSKGMICRILKPGKYSYLALGKGIFKWEGVFEVRQGKCLSYRLGYGR